MVRAIRLPILAVLINVGAQARAAFDFDFVYNERPGHDTAQVAPAQVALPAVAPTQPTEAARYSTASIQRLFGEGTLPSMSYIDPIYREYTSGEKPRQCRASWENVRQRKPQTLRDLTPGKVEELARRASIEGLNPRHVRRLLASFLANQREIPNQRYVTFVDFNKRSNQKRMVVIDLQNDSFKSYFVAAGKGSDGNGDGYARYFTNRSESNASSLGCHIVNGNFTDNQGRSALMFHGIEPTNSNTCVRHVHMHPAAYVGGVPGRSWGCPAVRPGDRKEVYDKLQGGSLFCSYYDGTIDPNDTFKGKSVKKSRGKKSRGKKGRGRRGRR